jgi:lipoyl-dependent peroxiredoxin
MIRKSMTEWQGDGPSGSGSLSTESGALRAQPYSFKTRFQGGEDSITSIALDLEAHVEGLPVDQFRALTEAAKTNCPVSKALSATPISLTARLA